MSGSKRCVLTPREGLFASDSNCKFHRTAKAGLLLGRCLGTGKKIIIIKQRTETNRKFRISKKPTKETSFDLQNQNRYRVSRFSSLDSIFSIALIFWKASSLFLQFSFHCSYIFSSVTCTDHLYFVLLKP